MLQLSKDEIIETTTLTRRMEIADWAFDFLVQSARPDDHFQVRNGTRMLRDSKRNLKAVR